MKHGFSLVELSIVLVVLGLLTGGILTGQNLIRAAELRSVTTEYANYQTAVMTFRDKYFDLPGDMRNATDFWGAADNSGTGGECGAPETDTGTGTETCNGNSNGLIGGVSGFGYERPRHWQQLANAGLIEGSYTGVFLSTTPTSQAGINVPAGKLSNSKFLISSFNSSLLNGWKNAYAFCINSGDCGDGSGVIASEEAWAIDVKIDDGIADQGALLASSDGNVAFIDFMDCIGTGGTTDCSYNFTSPDLMELVFKLN